MSGREQDTLLSHSGYAAWALPFSPQPFKKREGKAALCNKEMYATPSLYLKTTFFFAPKLRLWNSKTPRWASVLGTLVVGTRCTYKRDVLPSFHKSSTRSTAPFCCLCSPSCPHLGLDVISCHDVADRPQCWGGHFVVVVPAGGMAQEQTRLTTCPAAFKILSPAPRLHYSLWIPPPAQTKLTIQAVLSFTPQLIFRVITDLNVYIPLLNKNCANWCSTQSSLYSLVQLSA